ncbi:MAG: indolepyruvate ferredoxin oxidoreductase family protein [Acidimicrobiia bacterium]|nr:indolepyruvate ferredoxin oxidoreductase family protein [Acidimicrobiia bacterium]MYC57634.1 indolepyruvate ferredoxin oxidoreductase family protein [Acidimicrobiia bacterium]MYI30713.1 indolepyruvate ferredoxin oxidoreductase family protein [Acidimicrobiia bacterium]
MTATEPAVSYRLSDRYTKDHGTVFLTGLQAMARLPIEQLRVDRAAGLRTAAFAAGYPGSPLGGLDAALDSAVRQAGEDAMVLRPSINEESAATAVMGSQLAGSRPDAQYDGVIGIWYGKAPGVDRATDAIRHAVFTGAHPQGGVILFAGDDPSAKSSTLPSSTAGVLADLHVPVLYPGDPADVLQLGRHAIAMSRATGLWVGMKIVANVADGSASVNLEPNNVHPKIPLLNGEAYQHAPNTRLLTPYSLDIEQEIVELRTNLALHYAELNHLNRVVVDSASAWIGIISSGITYWEVREALASLGLASDEDIATAGIRLLRMGMPIPFNVSSIRKFAAGLEEIFVIEEKTPNVESRVKDALYNTSHRPQVVGEFDELDQTLIKSHGALHADDLVEPLRDRLAARLSNQLKPATPVRQRIPLTVNRTPYFCSGCPHNRSTVTDPNTAVGAGIGCHTMILLGDEKRYGDIAGITCMGNEGTQWIGMAPFVKAGHFIQNMGDGTFFHSGQMAITAAIAAKIDITYKLLWNGAVAMTGGQEPAGTIPLERVCRSLLAQGVSRIIITSDDPSRTRRLGVPDEVVVRNRTELAAVQQELAGVSGVTVLIHDQRCAAELRRERKRGHVSQPRTRVAINHRVCEGCGHCAEISNCLSVQPIETPFGRKTTIDQESCNIDLSCLEGDCPAFVTVTKPKRLWPKLTKTSAANDATTNRTPPPTHLPKPASHISQDVNIHITGIGGTGVVTAGQLIGTAAMLDGSSVYGLDQIGMSQKAGPVVSDLRISRNGRSGSNRLGDHQADLLLALDLLVAASDTGLGPADASRTAVVGSLNVTPPGTKTAHPETQMPSDQELLGRVQAETRPDAQHWAAATDTSMALVGEATGANVFVVGMAVQAGLLPISPEAVETAIGLNGVAVEMNTAAFRWGRWQMADPTAVSNAVTNATKPTSTRKRSARTRLKTTPQAILTQDLLSSIANISGDNNDLSNTLQMYASELARFQNRVLAHQFLDHVSPYAKLEQQISPGTTEITKTVAAGLFKLLAYKDEYEVARLLLDADGHKPVEAVAQPGDRLAWRLHPPFMRLLGRKQKIALSVQRWRPVICLLARAKWLRGTPLDPFGYTQLRREERCLPQEYLATLSQAAKGASSPEHLEAILEVAKSAELVRGYEGIKLANIAKFRAQLSLQSK